MSRLLRDRHRQEQEHRDRIKRDLAQVRQEPSMSLAKLPGDPVALRGIPAVGFGIGGAIRGSRPDQLAVG